MAISAHTQDSNGISSDVLIPDEEERDLARRSELELRELLEFQTPASKSAVILSVTVKSANRDIALPASTTRVLLRMLEYMSEGRAFSLFPQDAEVSTQVAADILNVSRPFVVKLIDRGEIPGRRVGAHRRLKIADVMKYREKMKESYKRAAAELTELHQSMGGYD